MTKGSAEQRTCERCGLPLGRFAPARVCSRCLLEAGLSGLQGEPAAEGRANKSPLGRFGNYEVLDEVGHGGMGVVYRARDLTLNRVVALKLMLAGQFAGEREVKRFRSEAQAAARLDHPNIVPIYEVGECEGQPFFSMKFVEGGPLTGSNREFQMSEHEAAVLIEKLARAVHYAHQRGILHRDIKPGNVLLDGQGEPQLTDFGLAKLVDKDNTLTRTMAMLGTPGYMSPEQARGEAKQLTTAVDVYGLGAVFYELLTGQPPFAGGTPIETVRQVVDKEPRRPSALKLRIDRDLETICLKCLEKEPARRYGSAEALAEELGRWLRKEPIQARPINSVERILKWMRRNPKVATLAILLNLVFAVGLAGILLVSARLASANFEKTQSNIRLAKNLRDFEWQKLDELATSGKRGDALANLADFLRHDPNDRVAATRLISMLSECNFALPAGAPMKHGAALNTLALSADGRRAVTAADDGKARVWDLQHGRLLATLTHRLKVTEAAFAADEQLVLTTSADGSFRLWDWSASRVAFEFPKAPDARMPAILSRDRKRVALLETDTSAQVWDLLRQQRLGGPLRVPSLITALTFGPDAGALAIGSEYHTLVVWKGDTYQTIAAQLKLPGGITTTAFSPDGAILAADWGGRLDFWDTSSWAKLREIQTSDTQILSMEFSPDGRRLVSTAWDRPLKIWDVASGQMVGQPIEAERPFAYFCISPDGTRLATRSQGGVARVWDALTGLALSEPFEHEGPITDLKFDPSGQFIITASQDGTAQVWNVQTGRSGALSFKTSDTYPCACFSLDGRLVVRTSEQRAEVFDAQTGKPRGKPMVHGEQVYRMKLSPDGKKLATAAWDNTGRVWDFQTGEPLTPPLKHRRRLYAIAFSPNGRLVATASEDDTARLWDSVTGQPIGPSLVHEGEVLHVDFSPDSRALLTASTDGTARLWSTDQGAPLWQQPLRHKGIVWTAEFSPDGRHIVTASADKSALVWDAQSRLPVTPPMLHEQSVTGAHFSPDGKWVLTFSRDGTARVWDASSGKPISQPMRHKDRLEDAVFSPDGRSVFTGSHDGVARLWDARTGYPLSEPLQHTGEVTGLQFSPDGRRCLSIAGNDALRIWEVVEPPVPAPDWFRDFVEAVAGRHCNERHDVEPVSRESLEPFRQKFASSQETDFYSRYAHWFLHERLKEPVPAFVP